MPFYNEITPEYETTRNSLGPTFYEAYEFLDWLEGISTKDFHLGTAINLHLYHKDKFLFYIKKESATQVIVSSKPNIKIKQGTLVDNETFFLLWLDMLKRSNLILNGGIIIKKTNEHHITLNRSRDSQLLFDTLKRAIKIFSSSKSL